MPFKRVVVTGVGVISPVGSSKAEFYGNLCAGKSGVAKLGLKDAGFPSKVAGQVADFDPAKWCGQKEARRMDRFAQLGFAAACEAVSDSLLDFSQEDPERSGAIIGSGIGGIDIFSAQHSAYLEKGPRGVSPFFVPMLIGDILSGHVSIRYGLKGPNFCVSSACATASHALGEAYRIIKCGEADIMLSGGAEAGVTPMAIAGFCSMKALSTAFNGEPEKASRPFDAKRDGFVISEGAGVLVLEEREHALKRGAHVYGEILGVGMSADACNMVAPHPEGAGAEQAMRLAMKAAGLNPDKIDYINAHGTSTHLGDLSEVKAVKRIFGEESRVMLCSTKSMTGHTLGAAGAIELIATLLAMEGGIVPPTINQEEPDPEIQIDCVPNVSRKAAIGCALSNSFGFGGHNASILVGRSI